MDLPHHYPPSARSGQDEPEYTDQPVSGPGKYTAHSIPDDRAYVPASARTAGERSSTSESGLHGSSTTIDPKGKKTGPIAGGRIGDTETGPVGAYTSPSDYEIKDGKLSEVVLHRYLDRSMMVMLLSHLWAPEWMEGPEYPRSYHEDTNIPPLYDVTKDHGHLLDMIVKSGAKMVWDLTFYSGKYPGWDYLEFQFKTFKHDLAYLHARDPEMICGASIAEFRPPEPTRIKLPPSDIIDIFYPSGRPKFMPSPPGGRPRLVSKFYFEPELMLYDWEAARANRGRTRGWDEASHMDLSKPETQMWYYWLSVNYIERDCELIHFGDLFIGCRNDEGNRHIWRLMTLIREYAKKYARRNFVLLCTHAPNDPSTDDPYADHYRFGWYYDDPATPHLPDWQKQLIFDFIALGVYYKRAYSSFCEGTSSVSDYGRSSLPVHLNPDSGLLNKSKGGVHPQGWLCSHSPVMQRFDQGGIDGGAGCSFMPPSNPYAPDCYGFDNTSWFARQKESLRQQILRYTYFYIKCFDPYSHFSMPGRFIFTRGVEDDDKKHYNGFTEEATIREIWDGTDVSPAGWVHHNFTLQNVANGRLHPNVRSNLVYVGKDKMYYIGDDGYIHGYIHNNGTYNGGTWLTVSPSYASQVPAGVQVKAKSDLVASPDGTRLLYIGTDGYIHGFDIIDVWVYKYIYSTNSGDVTPPRYRGAVYDGFFTKPMMDQRIKAVGGLIYPGNDRIFYIGRWDGDGSRYIHCFQKSSGIWQTNSPSYSAEGMYGQRVVGQYQASGGLAYDWSHNRLYYRTVNGYLAYFEVRSLTDFYYVACPGNFKLHEQGLKIVGKLAVHNNRIYFVGHHNATDSYYIHCLVDNGGGSWNTVSPSYSADHYGTRISLQAQAGKWGSIAVSPDGKTIAYISGPKFFQLIACFKNIDGIRYDYFVPSTSVLSTGEGDNSLQFISNTEMCYTAPWYDVCVHKFIFGVDYCNNSIFDTYPPKI